MQNRLIAVDGLDASGKRTQTELLSATLAEKGIDYRYISFPTYKGDGCAAVNMYLRGDFGADPNAVNAYAASSFFAVDRYTSYMLDWKKDMESGKVIIADRYSSANAVHQLSKMRPEERDGFLDWLCDFEFGKLGLPRPAAVIYLCMPPEMSECLLAARCRETGSTPDIHERTPRISKRATAPRSIPPKSSDGSGSTAHAGMCSARGRISTTKSSNGSKKGFRI